MKIVSKIVGCIHAILLVGKVDAGICTNQSNYNCGAKFPDNGNTCGGKGCCCHGENGTGTQVNTCDNGKGFTNRGCKSCWGVDACKKTNNMNIGSNSCHGKFACKETAESSLFNDSCQGQASCVKLKNTNVMYGSCRGDWACNFASNSTINNDSCKGTSACGKMLEQVTIGYGSCNAERVCSYCAEYSIVPDNACNDQDGVDTTDKKFNYCMSIDTRAEVAFVANDTGRRSLASCGDNHNKTSIMEEVSDIVLRVPALRRLKNTFKKMSSGLDGEQTLTITIDFFARGMNTGEMPLNQFLKTKLEEKRAESPSCFTLQSIVVVNRDDPASLPSWKKKKSKSNKKQTASLHKK